MESCLIWGTPCRSVKPSERDPLLDLVYGSPRAGGNYRVADYALNHLTITDQVRARLTTWLIDQRNAGVSMPTIGMDEVTYALERGPLPVHERADRLLKLLVQETPHVGATLQILGNYDRATQSDSLYMNALAWSESHNGEELRYIADYLCEQRWITIPPGADIGTLKYRCRVEVDGYARIGEQATALDSSQCFVAMWFDPSMNDAYHVAIAPAIRDAGYEPFRIDQQVDLVGKIDDAIVAEIRRSRFLVADMTHGDEGARGGVYYEAGFAYGLDKPVIYTCREDKIDDVHFDNRQFNHIVWDANNLDDLRKRLTDRIVAAIGEGPTLSRP